MEQGLCFQLVPVDWKYCVQTTDSVLWGCCYTNLKALYYSDDQSRSAVLVHEFAYPITSLFISQKNVLFVCSNGVVYKSDDRAMSFKVVLTLSSAISYFLFNNGMTELPDHTLMIGEYGSIWQGKTWQNLAFLYYSFDGGDTWSVADFLLRQGVNKHIHLVKYCTRLKAILLTDGDNKKQVWVNSALAHFNKHAGNQKDGWHLINKYHHQTGGYTSMAETKEAVLFGSDYLGGTNFIVKTSDGKQFEKLVLPDPYRRSPVMNMIAHQSTFGTEIWAASYSCLSGDAKSLLMCTNDSGKSWARVIEFDGTRHEVRLASSSNNPSSTPYISITEFGNQQDQHRHRVYKLDRDYEKVAQ
ncbi:beta propeller repeat protein [Spirosoma flavum]